MYTTTALAAQTLPAGFIHMPAALARFDLDKVRDAIAWEQKNVTVFGRTSPTPRLTAWFGVDEYTYSGARNHAQPMPAIVRSIQVAAETAAGVVALGRPVITNSALGNLYRSGADCVGWHSDDEPELGKTPTILSVSLGAARDFQIRPTSGGETVTIRLEHGDLVIMHGLSQKNFRHCVPRRAGVGERVNLTFRHHGIDRA